MGRFLQTQTGGGRSNPPGHLFSLWPSGVEGRSFQGQGSKSGRNRFDVAALHSRGGLGQLSPEEFSRQMGREGSVCQGAVTGRPGPCRRRAGSSSAPGKPAAAGRTEFRSQATLKVRNRDVLSDRSSEKGYSGGGHNDGSQAVRVLMSKLYRCD